MARTFNCKLCGDAFENPNAHGRPPVRCVNCDPKAWSEEARAAALARRRRLEALERAAPVTSAPEVEPGAGLTPIGCLADPREQPRLALSQAVRNVGRAEGRHATHGALTELVDVARRWQSYIA